MAEKFELNIAGQNPIIQRNTTDISRGPGQQVNRSESGNVGYSKDLSGHELSGYGVPLV